MLHKLNKIPFECIIKDINTLYKNDPVMHVLAYKLYDLILKEKYVYISKLNYIFKPNFINTNQKNLVKCLYIKNKDYIQEYAITSDIKITFDTYYSMCQDFDFTNKYIILYEDFISLYNKYYKQEKTFINEKTPLLVWEDHEETTCWERFYKFINCFN